MSENEKKNVSMATSLEGQQPNLAWIIYGVRPTSWKKTAKIDREHFELIGPEEVVQTRISVGS